MTNASDFFFFRITIIVINFLIITAFVIHTFRTGDDNYGNDTDEIVIIKYGNDDVDEDGGSNDDDENL